MSKPECPEEAWWEFYCNLASEQRFQALQSWMREGRLLTTTPTSSPPRKRYAKITRDGCSCILPLDMAIEEARIHYYESEAGESFTWKNVDMTEDEYNALPEFTGW